MVNTTIRNTADFPQAFPIMVLSFNSASNSIVALREFSPDLLLVDHQPTGLVLRYVVADDEIPHSLP